MVEVTNEQWERIEPLLARAKPCRKGGRPWADDRTCFEGILWILRSGAWWRDLPDRFPSPSTCWCRLTEWEPDGEPEEIWNASLNTLHAQGRIDWDEVFIDGTFAPTKRGRPSRKNQARKWYEAGGGWLGSLARMTYRVC